MSFLKQRMFKRMSTRGDNNLLKQIKEEDAFFVFRITITMNKRVAQVTRLYIYTHTRIIYMTVYKIIIPCFSE